MEFHPREQVLTGDQLRELVAISPDEEAMKTVSGLLRLMGRRAEEGPSRGGSLAMRAVTPLLLTDTFSSFLGNNQVIYSPSGQGIQCAA